MGQALMFTIGKDEFGVDIGFVVEVIRTRDVRQVSDLPEYIKGFITVRKEVIPLIDLKRRFNVHRDSDKERIMIIKYMNEKVALLVDSVSGILKYEDKKLKSPPSVFRGLKAKYISGMIEREGKPIILIDANSILSSREKITLKKARGRIEKESAE